MPVMGTVLAMPSRGRSRVATRVLIGRMTTDNKLMREMLLDSKKTGALLSVVITLLFLAFLLPIAMNIMAFSRFFKQRIQGIFNRYGHEPVIYVTMNENVKGLMKLLIYDLKQGLGGRD